MIRSEQIEKLVAEFVEGSDMFLVESRISPANDIEVFIDADTSVNIDACVKLSRHIEAELDRETEDFTLNVSSSGLDMPLKMPRQYKKYIGKELEVLCRDGIKLTAELKSADENGITLHWQAKELVEGKKRKQLVDKEVQLLYTDIKKTLVIISFK